MAAHPASLQRGIFAIIISMLAFVVGDTVLKIVGTSLPMTEIIFLRSCVIAGAILIFFLIKRQKFGFTAKTSWPILVRCVFDSVNIAAITTAIIHMGLAELYAIFLTSPLMITVIAALLLKEPVGLRRWLAVAVGFFGVILIVKPDPSAVDPWALLALLSAVTSACREVITRKIDQNIPALEVAFYSAVFVGLMALLFGLTEGWIMPTREQTGLVTLQGVAWLCGTFFVIHACRIAPMSSVAPFRYSILIWGALAGYLFFGDIPDNLSLVGAALIGGAGLYTFHREAVLNRSVRPPPLQ